jgi:eukaryotic-like serine/threonine-protein kinase
VARVSDVGTLDNGAPYMVMEYLEGGDLSAWVQQRGVLPVEQAVEFVLQACEAIADAHGLGIVHRDLKPANLFCIRRSDGVLSIKVLDFGISKVSAVGSSPPDLNMTKTTAMMGSPLYMSPEQMQSTRDVDARTDIWSIGIVLYELLTGKPPFLGETLADVCIKAATLPPPPMQQSRPDVPAELEAVIQKCLHKDRNLRYRNVAELAIALAPFGPKRARASVERINGIIQGAGLSVSALSLPPSSEAISADVPNDTQAVWGQTTPRKKWGLGGVGITTAMIGIGAIAGVAVIWSRHGDSTANSASAPTATTERAAGVAISANVVTDVGVNAVPSIAPLGAATAPLVAPVSAPAASGSASAIAPLKVKPPRNSLARVLPPLATTPAKPPSVVTPTPAASPPAKTGAGGSLGGRL